MENVFYSFVIYPLTQIIEFVFSFCNHIFENTGISILGVSCAVSLLTLPLYIVAEHWQQVERNIQKKMKPEVDKIKAVFHGNEQYMILSTYYRQNHYHPIMSLRSAFGLLIQIPFFTAAYSCLSHMDALQGQTFLFIRNMGAPDALFTIGNFNVNILPIAMTLINMVSGTLYTRGLSIRDKIQTYGLALVFVVILYDSPAGLVMYWTMNNIFSLIKNVFYKLKNPIKTLYIIASILITLFIFWLFTSQTLSVKRAVLVSAVFSIVYFTPIIVKVLNWLVNDSLTELINKNKINFTVFTLACLNLTILIGLVLSSKLIAVNPVEFCGIKGYEDPTFFIKNTSMQAVGFFCIWASLIFYLYNNNKKVQVLLSFAFTWIFYCSIINAFIFTGNYGNISTSLIFTTVSSVDSPLKLIFLNIIVVIILGIAIIQLIKFKKTFILNFISTVSMIALLSFGIYNYSLIKGGYKQYKLLSTSKISEIKPIFHFSKTGKNVLLLYLDRAQGKYLEEIFNESPELYKQFEGFTFYPQTLSTNGHTLTGSPPCFGGYEYTPEKVNARSDVKLITKTNEALTVLPRIFTEQGNNFSATVTDMPWANHEWIPDMSIYDKYPLITGLQTDSVYNDYWFNSHKEFENLENKEKILKRNLLWYDFFMSAPLALRPAFYNQGNYWSTAEKNDDFIDFLDGYSVLEYLQNLTDTNCSTENSFICFVNNTTHDDYPLQAPEYKPVLNVTDKGKSKFSETSDYAINAGSLKRVGEWFEYLKMNNIYDNTRIVIVADHGAEGEDFNFIYDEKFEKITPGKYHPLLMFKDFNSRNSLKIDNSFMTNADTPVLLLNGLIDNPINPYTNNIMASDKENGVCVSLSDVFTPLQNKNKYIYSIKPDEWYRVKGNIFDSTNWTQEAQ